MKSLEVKEYGEEEDLNRSLLLIERGRRVESLAGLWTAAIREDGWQDKWKGESK